MRYCFFFIALQLAVSAKAQQERDTLLSRCPVAITDTVSNNNYFVEARPATLKVYRVRGKLTIAVQQKDQFFTLFFHEKKLKNSKYDIEPGSKGKDEVEATYSFKSGDQVAYINVASGTIHTTFDKEKNVWKLKVLGLITNLTDRTLTYYRVKGDLTIK